MQNSAIINLLQEDLGPVLPLLWLRAILFELERVYTIKNFWNWSSLVMATLRDYYCLRECRFLSTYIHIENNRILWLTSSERRYWTMNKVVFDKIAVMHATIGSLLYC